MQGTQGETSKSSGLFTEAGEWVPKETCTAIEEVSSISERLMHMREPDRVPHTISIPKLLNLVPEATCEYDHASSCYSLGLSAADKAKQERCASQVDSFSSSS